jgi:lipoprotein-anchoring transpeptidase ErfK/SrfK
MKMRLAAGFCLLVLSASAAAQAARQPDAVPLQVALDRAGFSPGEIDGKAGSCTRRALAAFQAAHGLPLSGVADPATAAKLREGTPGDPLIGYTITAEDAAGPYVEKIPDDMMEKAALSTLGYTSVVESLGERFHASPDLLRRLNPGSGFAAGDVIRVPDVLRAPATGEGAKAARVTVSKSRSVAEAVDDSGRILFFAPITAGSEKDPLPLGNWKVKGVARNPAFAYNPDLFWDADAAHAKARIAAGPNNPVGVVWIDLDKEHYGLHGTAEPAKVGHAESHGCVRLTNWDAEALAALVGPGTPVLFVE